MNIDNTDKTITKQQYVYIIAILVVILVLIGIVTAITKYDFEEQKEPEDIKENVEENIKATFEEHRNDLQDTQKSVIREKFLIKKSVDSDEEASREKTTEEEREAIQAKFINI